MTVSSLKHSMTRLIGPVQSAPAKTRKRRQRTPANGAITNGGGEQVAVVAPESLIQHNPLFAELNPQEQAMLAQWMLPETFEPDEVLFGQDSPSEGLYLIQEGWVKLRGNTDSATTTLGAGDIVGGTDFFLGRTYTATASASGKVTAWVLSRQALTELIAACPQIGLELGLAFGTGIVQFHDHLAQALAQVPLLQDLSIEERRHIARHLSPQRYLPRETIYRSGDPPAGVFFIEQGQVWLLSEGNNQLELGPGQTFGESTVISGKPDTYTAQSKTEAILWQLSPADFASLAEAYPSIRARFSQNLHESLDEALAIAALIVKNEIAALQVASGTESKLVEKLQQVRDTLSWLKGSQMLL